MGEAPVLVLHAAGLDARAADFLGLDGLVTVTLPGHGRRAPARDGLSLADMADEIAGWVDRPVNVVGMSLGGMVAQHLALAHPYLVRSLVLACTTSRTPTTAILERAAATAAAPTEETVRTTLERWFTEEFLGQDPEPAALGYARECLSTIDRRSFATVWRAIAGHDVADRLHEVDVPTTCLAGSHDVSTPPGELAELARPLPNARFVEIDAPHMASLEQPVEVRRVVTEHLRWTDAVYQSQ